MQVEVRAVVFDGLLTSFVVAVVVVDVVVVDVDDDDDLPGIGGGHVKNH
jgi:hypothetical protein